jgi:membrane associated rhomboid family serine protease
MGYEAVAISYRRVMLERQFYRVLTATLCHLNVMHIIFNMATLYSAGGQMEAAKGSGWYLETTVLLLAAGAGLWMAMTHALVHYLGRPGAAEASAVGYSGVLFGWIALESLVFPNATFPLPFGISLPVIFAPFVQLAITHLIMPRASFLGHLSGMLGGYLVGLGAAEWVRGYWTAVLVAWASLLCVLSLKANSALPAAIGRYVWLSPEYSASTLVGGIAGDAGENVTQSVRRIMTNGILRVVRPVARDEVILSLPAPSQAAAGGTARPVGGSPVPAAVSPTVVEMPTLPSSRPPPSPRAARLSAATAPTAAPARGSEEEGEDPTRGLLSARAGPGPTSVSSSAGGSISVHEARSRALALDQGGRASARLPGAGLLAGARARLGGLFRSAFASGHAGSPAPTPANARRTAGRRRPEQGEEEEEDEGGGTEERRRLI